MSVIGDIFRGMKSANRNALMPIRTMGGINDAWYSLAAREARTLPPYRDYRTAFGPPALDLISYLSGDRRRHLGFARRYEWQAKAPWSRGDGLSKRTLLSMAAERRAQARSAHEALRARYVRANNAINELKRPRGPNSKL